MSGPTTPANDPPVPARLLRTYPESRFGGFTRWDGSLAFLNRVHAMLPDAGLVLDVGCGRGLAAEDRCRWRRKLSDLRGPGRRVIGIDVDDAGAENPIIDEFRPIRPDGGWPIESGTVDCAVARCVLEHVPDPDAFLAELARVLKPGGFFAAHTPNRLGYPAIAASLVPNRLHARVVGAVQDGRQAKDVFPTYFRMNSAGRLRRLAAKHGLDCVVHTWEAEPSYLSFSPILYRIGAAVHRIIPAPFRTVLLIWAQRPAAPTRGS